MTVQTSNDHDERIDLPITGMTCAGCVNRVEKSLQQAPGVRRASVNFATSRATVEYDSSVTGVPQLVDRVKGAGYDVVTAPLVTLRKAHERAHERAHESTGDTT